MDCYQRVPQVCGAHLHASSVTLKSGPHTHQHSGQHTLLQMLMLHYPYYTIQAPELGKPIHFKQFMSHAGTAWALYQLTVLQKLGLCYLKDS